MDVSTPTGGDTIDIIPPYIANGHHGQLIELSYTEEVAGSSPVPPTLLPPSVGVFVSFYLPVGELLGFASFEGEICCNVLQPAATIFTTLALLSFRVELPPA